MNASLPQPSPKRMARFKATVALTVTVIALAGTEIAVRVIDGYRLGSIRLEVSRELGRKADSGRHKASQKWQRDDDPLPYVEQIPVGASVDRKWFSTPSPERHLAPPDTDLDARTNRYKQTNDMRPNYEWNWKFVTGAVCRANHHEGAEVFDLFDDIFVFDPTDGSESPTYRFLRNATYSSGLRTNAFGWRGPDIPLRKPSNTVRIAFVGASTTVGPHDELYSYPELVGLWLNQWAAAHHPGITFETINAGREGINSRSIQGVVRQELLPVEPDLVVYYEGSNQFWPANFIWTVLPPRSRVSGPQPSVLAYYSAIARRVESVVRRAVVPGVEPVKPDIVVHWPNDLDEHDPNLAHPQLPIELPHILSDLEIMRRSLDEDGSKFVMTSFVWVVYPGLVLDPVRDAGIFDYLNGMFWPYTYAHMRRFLDFQTQAFRKYSSAHGVDFIDVARQYPRDPRLFTDGIHMTRAGVHLQAWVVFNGLVPIIERQLASHELPRAARHPLSKHPAFGDRRLVPMADVRAACATSAR